MRKAVTISLFFFGLMTILAAQGMQAAPERNQNRILYTRAQALERMGRTKEAIDIYTGLVTDNPTNQIYYLRLAGLLRRLKQFDDYLKIIDLRLKYNPRDINLRLEKAGVLYNLDQKNQAKVLWNNIVNTGPPSNRLYTRVANSQLLAGAVDDALQTLLTGRRKLNDPGAYAAELARVYAARMMYAKASREYIRHLEKYPQQENYITQQFIAMLKDVSAYTIIAKQLRNALAGTAQPAVLRAILGRVYFFEKDYQKVAKLFQAPETRADDLPEMLDMAQSLERARAWEPASELYLKVSRQTRSDGVRGQALLGLARTYEKRLIVKPAYPSLGGYFPGNRFFHLDMRLTNGADGSLTEALAIYDSLCNTLPNSESANRARFQIADIQLTITADFDNAARGFEYILRHAHAQSLALAAGQRWVDALLAKGDTLAARSALKKTLVLANADEDDPEIVYSQARIQLNSGNLHGAVKSLANLTGAAKPTDPLFNDALEVLAVIHGNGGPDDKSLKKYFRAEALVSRHKLTEAVSALDILQRSDALIADEAALRQIQLLEFLNQDDLAESLLNDFLAERLDSNWLPQALIWQGELYQFRRHDPVQAVPYYEELLVNHPTNLQVEQIRQRLRQIVDSHPDPNSN